MSDTELVFILPLQRGGFESTPIIQHEWNFEADILESLYLSTQDHFRHEWPKQYPDIQITVYRLDLNTIEHSPKKSNQYIFMTDFFWYALKQQSAIDCFAGRNIIIWSSESKPNGYLYMDQYWGHQPKFTLDKEYLENFNSVGYVIDNCHPELQKFDNVQIFPSLDWSYSWLRSLHPDVDTDENKKILRSSDTNAPIDWKLHREKMDIFYDDWNSLWDYTLSLGTYKTFRMDLLNKIYQRGLDDRGYIGTYCDTWNFQKRAQLYDEASSKVLTEPVDHSLIPEKITNLPGDLELGYDVIGAGGFTYNPQCLYNSKVEIVVESVAEPNRAMVDTGIKIFNSEPFPISQPTEKTCRMLLLGKPFLIVSTTMLYEQLTDWGFDLYSSVFGDYRGRNFEETNNNVCDVIAQINNREFDTNELRRIANHNFENAKRFASIEYNILSELGKYTTSIQEDMDYNELFVK